MDDTLFLDMLQKGMDVVKKLENVKTSGKYRGDRTFRGSKDYLINNKVVQSTLLSDQTTLLIYFYHRVA